MINIYLIKYTDLQKAKDRILSKYSQVSGNTYSIDYSPNGAPQLISGSLQKAYVSISHTDGLLAMAFSDDKVGIDVERADREVSPKVCKSIEEWTRIEAYAKWTGKGLSKDILHLPASPHHHSCNHATQKRNPPGYRCGIRAEGLSADS